MNRGPQSEEALIRTDIARRFFTANVLFAGLQREHPAAFAVAVGCFADEPAWLRLRTRQLLLVARLGDERHLGRAAAAMGISQPAATRLLQELEDTLGAPLFTRGARGMQPTPGGEVLLRYARQLLNDLGATRRELAALAAGLHGTLRVAPKSLSIWRA